MLLWSVGGRQSQTGTLLSQARSDPLLTPRWAPSSPLGSSVCCRVRQAMGLCAGFGVADSKPICGGKIGLVYHPSFIAHIPFVYPTNYNFSCCRHSLLFSLLPTQMHGNKSENQIQQATLAQSQRAMRCRPQSIHKERDCWRKITWYKEENRRQSRCYIVSQNPIVSLAAHTAAIWSIVHQLRTRVGVSRLQTTSIENMASLSWTESWVIAAVPTVITCVFLYSKYTLAYCICKRWPPPQFLHY